MIRITYVAGLVAALGVVACNSNSGAGDDAGAGGARSAGGANGPGGGGTDSPDATAPDTGAGSPGFKLTWSVSDARRDFMADGGGVTDAAIASLPGLGGVKVCVHDMPEIDCATSTEDGVFELDGLPPRANLVLTFEKEGFSRESRSIQTASTDMNLVGTDVVMSPVPPKLPDGSELDPEKGSVDFFAIKLAPDAPGGAEILAGATVSISPQGGTGPYFYLGTKYQPGATTTRSGVGFYFNLAPGDYTLTMAVEGYDCSAVAFPFAAFGIPVDGAPDTVRFTVLPGYLTDEVGVLCTEKSVIVDTDGG